MSEPEPTPTLETRFQEIERELNILIVAKLTPLRATIALAVREAIISEWDLNTRSKITGSENVEETENDNDQEVTAVLGKVRSRLEQAIQAGITSLNATITIQMNKSGTVKKDWGLEIECSFQSETGQFEEGLAELQEFAELHISGEKERALVAALIEAGGKEVLEPSTLMAKADLPSAHALDSALQRLRKTLKTKGKHLKLEEIKNIRGKGYILRFKK